MKIRSPVIEASNVIPQRGREKEREGAGDSGFRCRSPETWNVPARKRGEGTTFISWLENRQTRRSRWTRRREKQMMMKEERKFLKYEALPDYMKDNEYILDYYRCEWPLKDTFLSVFLWHNETLNVWTLVILISNPSSFQFLFLFPFFAFGWIFYISTVGGDESDREQQRRRSNQALMHYCLLALQDIHLRHFSHTSLLGIRASTDSSPVPTWPWFVFLAGAMCCLLFSSVSHLLACHSRSMSLFFWRLDYTGIAIMIVCSFFSPIYYAFYCQSFWRILYLTSISVLGIIGIITLLAPCLSCARFRNFRVSLFLSMGFSGVIPAVHAAILHWGQSEVMLALGYEVLMGFLYAIGVGFYVSRVPERWKPGAFDLTGHSHQIFHVFVVAGALAHSAGSLVILNWRRGMAHC
ncbi:hypothetical protein Cgig2_014359 [Carnegiea gigantea]|uniref:Uncharacterized protein n=1 Tax=Carnegiea gigantea TaxID=171969 RepID=A0A9Q1KE85_9CARY|nr:hypothetical protein Cgig2_014359 [Carnegiea gigantea]